MKPLYTNEQYIVSKSMDTLPCQCLHCNNIFYMFKKKITYIIKHNILDRGLYCSTKCKYDSKNKRQLLNCKNCDLLFEKRHNDIKRTNNHFCSHSCSTTYNNKNKTTGTRRSKLEIWLEEQLTQLYPNIPIDFNKKDAIGSELDIYIPSLNLAFELNGIFHYEPIYGVNKLNQIQENDISKSKACHEAKIDLCIIDTSQQKYVKPSTSQKYLDIINNIINERLLTS